MSKARKAMKLQLLAKLRDIQGSASGYSIIQLVPGMFVIKIVVGKQSILTTLVTEQKGSDASNKTYVTMCYSHVV